MLFFVDCHCHAPPVIASASTAKSAARERPANMTRRRDLGFFGGSTGSADGSPTRSGRDALEPCAPQRRQIGDLVGVGHHGDDLGVRVGRLFGSRRLGPKLPRLSARGGCAADGGGAGGSGAQASPVARVRARVRAQRAGWEIRRRGAGDLRDQVGHRHTVGVAIRLRGGVVVVGLSSRFALPRRGGSRWQRRSGKPLIGAVRVGRARATRSGVIAVTHVPTGLRPYEQRARRCASAAALPPELKRRYPWPRVWSQ